MNINPAIRAFGGLTRSLASVTAVLLIVGVTACGGGGGGDAIAGPPPPSVAVGSVAVTPGTVAVLIGESSQLGVIVRDQAGNALVGRAVSWTTSDATVATVSASGIAAGTGVGTATITATSETKSGSATISVIAVSQVNFASVAAGGAHTCALTAAAAAYCWGRGESGQLGATPSAVCQLEVGSFACSLIPIPVGGGLAFARLAAGGAHTCALTSAGVAYCWGANSNGQLGDNSTTARSAPVAVATDLKFASIDAGANHTCALTSAGAAYCWGRNFGGEIGDGSTTHRSAPVAVAGGHAFQLITAGGFSQGHTCALTVAGDAYCWGDNGRGQLGIGSSHISTHITPAKVAGTVAFRALTAGLGSHTCGSNAAGAAYCWGENTFGGLGDGSSTDRTTPVPVSGGLAFAQLVAGGFVGHTCGLTGNGGALCWGDNEVGAVGDGSHIDRLVPAAVSGGFAWASIDAGFRHTCARTTAGAVYCWGSGRTGQLGLNAVTSRNVPTKVIGQP